MSLSTQGLPFFKQDPRTPTWAPRLPRRRQGLREGLQRALCTIGHKDPVQLGVRANFCRAQHPGPKAGPGGLRAGW